jgi:tetratricopeptide (TPR) repeat protein
MKTSIRFIINVFCFLICIAGYSSTRDSEEIQLARQLSLLGEYDSAAHIYSRLIDSTLESSESNVTTLYAQRADLYFAQKRFEDALADYQVVILQADSEGEVSNKLVGICGSLFCFELLHEDELAKATFDCLVSEVDKLGKEIENVEWLRNNFVYQYYKENIRGKKEKCKCKNNEKNDLRNQTLDIPSMTPEESCQLQCNGYAVAAGYACSRVPNAAVQFVCYGSIFGLEQACLRCCKGAGFWENCVKPLRRLFHDPDHPENPASHPYE